MFFNRLPTVECRLPNDFLFYSQSEPIWINAKRTVSRYERFLTHAHKTKRLVKENRCRSTSISNIHRNEATNKHNA